MDIFTKSDLPPVYEETEQETEFGVCRTPDRKHADSLLHISEQSFAKEDDAFDLHAESGWEDAIQGWGMSSPLSCLFQMQKKGKKSRTADNDYHCLLCIDVNLLKHSESDHSTDSPCESTKTICSSGKKHKDKSIPDAFLKGPSRHPSPVTEHHTFKLFTEAINQATSADKTYEEPDLCTLRETSPKLAYAYNLVKQCPLMEERAKNVTMIFNSFAVLPPVKAEDSSNLRNPNLLKGTVATFNQSAAHSIRGGGGSHGVSATGEMAGVERMWEITPQTHTRSVVPEFSHRFSTSEPRGPPCWHWPSQSSKHLQSALNLPNPKKCDMPFNIVGDLFPRAANPLGKHLKYDDLSKISFKNNHSHRLYIALKSKGATEMEPQLPMLLGTRVPMPASSHRLL